MSFPVCAFCAKPLGDVDGTTLKLTEDIRITSQGGVHRACENASTGRLAQIGGESIDKWSEALLETIETLQADVAEMIYEYAHGSTLESPDDLARVVIRRLKERLAALITPRF